MIGTYAPVRSRPKVAAYLRKARRTYTWGLCQLSSASQLSQPASAQAGQKVGYN